MKKIFFVSFFVLHSSSFILNAQTESLVESGKKKLTVERLQQLGRVLNVATESIIGNGKRKSA